MSNNTTGALPSVALDKFIIIEICYQCVFFAVGVPINIVSLRHHWQSLRGRTSKGQDHRLARLSIHLIVANLMILAIYCCARSIWLYTYWWKGGDVMCRLYSFFASFAFYLSSNIVAAISIDLCHCVTNPLRAQIHSGSFVRRLVLGAWLLAIGLAAPQLFLRGTVTVMEKPVLIQQCYFLFYENRYHVFRSIYGVAHLLAVFYVPLIIILLCYVGISLKIRKRLSERKSIITGSPSGTEKSAMELSHSNGGSKPAIINNRVQMLRNGSTAGSPVDDHNRKLGKEGSKIQFDSTLGTETFSCPSNDYHSHGQNGISHDLNGNCNGGGRLEKARGSIIIPGSGKEAFQRFSRCVAVKLGQIDKPTPDLRSLVKKKVSHGYRIRKRIFLLSVAIIGSYIFTWLPYQVFAAWKLICSVKKNCGQNMSRFEWLEAVLLLSTCITPFLYTWNCRRKPRNLQIPDPSGRSSAGRFESGLGSMSQPAYKSSGSDFDAHIHNGSFITPNSYITAVRRGQLRTPIN